jgi:hypothetical protein
MRENSNKDLRAFKTIHPRGFNMLRKGYNTSEERPPSKAAVKSYLAADQDAKNWEQTQPRRYAVDKEGTKWQVKMIRDEDYMNHKPLKPFGIMVHVSLTYSADAQSLITNGIFSNDEDERLLGFLGESQVPIELKAFYVEGTEKAAVDREVRARLESLVKEMPNRAMRALKRKFVTDWIHHSRGFSKK